VLLRMGSLTLVYRWAALPLPSQIMPKSSKVLVDLFSEIKFTVGQENEIVQAVFPHPILVMGVFLQRVFAQCVSAIVATSYHSDAKCSLDSTIS